MVAQLSEEQTIIGLMAVIAVVLPIVLWDIFNGF